MPPRVDQVVTTVILRRKQARRSAQEASGLVVWDASSMVPVLLVTGPIGVGKTAVLHEADSLLIDAGVGHATVELEEIARCWPEASEAARVSFVYQNLAALWSNFVSAAATRLLLSGLVEGQLEERPVSEAVPA